MVSTTHIAIGLIVGEVCWQTVRRNGQSGYYWRGWFWLLGIIGGYSPDFDGLSGIGAILFFRNQDSFSTAIFRYHRSFSHGLVFFFTALVSILILLYYNKRLNLEKLEVEHPFGKVPPETSRLNGSLMILFILTFFLYYEQTKFPIFFTLIALQGMLLCSYIRDKRPWYGLVFFLGALSHQFADFINCRWQPFAPWDSSIEWGLYINCAEWNNLFLKLIIEGPFHLIAGLIVINGLFQLRKYKKD